MQIEEIEKGKDQVRSRIWVEIEIEGVAMDALVDTGAQFSFINLRTARQYFQHLPWKTAMLKPKTTSGERLKVVAQYDLAIKIGTMEAKHKIYIVQNSPRKVLIGDDFLGNYRFTIGYPGRWVWPNQERIPIKTVMAPVIAEIEEISIVGEVAENIIIPARTGKWVPVVAPSAR